LIAINASIVEVSLQYNDICDDVTTNPCDITIKVPELMEKPVFFYYEIDNFYQNHRRYINSRSTKQLAGEKVDESVLRSDCSPVVTNAQMGQTVAVDGTTILDPNAIAIPCGLIAKSMFTGKEIF